MTMKMTMTTLPTQLGELTLVATDDALAGVYFPQHRPAPRHVARVAVSTHRTHPLLRRASDELLAYLSGERVSFSVPITLRGTELQGMVWEALLAIPRGETRTYGALASSLGRPGAARAVGHAVARNPLSIIVPCHRVVGADGALTGFAGGLARKAALLALEQQPLGQRRASFANNAAPRSAISSLSIARATTRS